ncbi:hypothetical protein ACF1AE_00195 [Streptomyces sp. NPDC014986]
MAAPRFLKELTERYEAPPAPGAGSAARRRLPAARSGERSLLTV